VKTAIDEAKQCNSSK